LGGALPRISAFVGKDGIQDEVKQDKAGECGQPQEDFHVVAQGPISVGQTMCEKKVM
jgi:hypothetical protein